MQEIIQNSLMITAFVLLMMLVIEYINIQTKGKWDKPLRKKPWLQIVVAALLGAIPGCLGVYTVVSLFTHKVVSFGALVSAMIATSGDEAFIMFAMIPEKALWLSLIIFAVAILAGFITNIFYKNVSFSKKNDHNFDIHHSESKCACPENNSIKNNLRNLTFTRALILTGLAFFLVYLFVGKDHHTHDFSINQEIFSSPVIQKTDPKSKIDLHHNHQHEAVHAHAHESSDEKAHQHGGEHEHDCEHDHAHNHAHNHAHTEVDQDRPTEQIAHVHDSHAGHDHAHLGHDHSHEGESHFNVAKIIFILLTLFAIFVVISVPNHFIEEHAWNHVIKKHFLKVFLWTFGTLITIYLVTNYIEFDMIGFIKDNMWLILIFAVLVGFIPESGPHMIFIGLFVAGIAPFSILLANSIVQDGHGALPLFAENKKAFFHMKFINIIAGLAVGSLGIIFGF